MRPDYVADVGNTRIKWAACDGPHIAGAVASVPEDEAAWEAVAPPPATWLIASVRPERSDRLRAWLEARGHRTHLLTTVPHSRLRVSLDPPAKAGIDRLLNAVAANTRVKGPDVAIIDAGSAVTVDLVHDGTFHGGVIFPGLDLMAEALHRYTALLPRVEVTRPLAPPPGRSTAPAIQLGVYHAVVGGIKDVLAAYDAYRVFLTGGAAPLLAPALPGVEVWPEMTLAGILACAKDVP